MSGLDSCNNHGLHKTIYIEYEDRFADVDEEIAPLVLLMWKNGIETSFSCQDCGESMNDEKHKGWFSIQFHGDEKLNKFLDMIAVPSEKIGLPKSSIHPFPFFIWEFVTYPVWLGNSMMMHSIMFPAEYKEYLMLRLTRCLQETNYNTDATHEEIESIQRAVYHRYILSGV